MLQVMRYTLQLATYFCRLNVLTAEIVTMRGDFLGTVFAAAAEGGGRRICLLRWELPYKQSLQRT